MQKLRETRKKRKQEEKVCERMSKAVAAAAAATTAHQNPSFTLAKRGDFDAATEINRTIQLPRTGRVLVLTDRGVELHSSPGSGATAIFAATRNASRGAVTPDESRLFLSELCTNDKNLIVCIDLATGKEVLSARMTEHVISLAVDPSGAMLAAGTRDGKVVLCYANTLQVKKNMILSTDNNKTKKPIAVGSSFASSLKFTPDGSCVVAANKNGFVHAIDVASEPPKQRWAPVKVAGECISCSVSDDGKMCVVGGDDGIVRVLNLADGTTVREFVTASKQHVYGAEFLSPQHLLISDDVKCCSIYDIALNRQVQEIDDCGYCISLSADKCRILASSGDSKRVTIISVTSTPAAAATKEQFQ